MEKDNTQNNQTNLMEVKEEKSNLLSNSLINSITTNFGEQVKLVYKKENRSKIMVSPENLVETALYLRNNHGFDHAESASGTDYPADNQIEINYHLGSYSNTIIILTL